MHSLPPQIRYFPAFSLKKYVTANFDDCDAYALNINSLSCISIPRHLQEALPAWVDFLHFRRLSGVFFSQYKSLYIQRP